MASLEEALSSSSSAPDIGPAQAALFASPSLLTARSVFLTQQYLNSEARESLTAQLARLDKAENFHRLSLDSVLRQKTELNKLVKALDDQSEATKQLGRELGYSNKLESAAGASPGANPIIDWFKSTTRLGGSDVLIELAGDSVDGGAEEGGSSDGAATFTETLESVAEPGAEWSPAGDANPEEVSQSGWHGWEDWSGEEHGGVPSIPVSGYRDSWVAEPGSSEAAVAAAEAPKRRKTAVPPKTPPPGYVRPPFKACPPMAIPGPPEKGSVAKAKPKPRYPWRGH